MLLSYLKTSYRSISRDKKHFFLNLFGFGIGLAAALIVGLFVAYELSYDKQHPHAERTYRVHTDYSSRGLQEIGSSNASLSQEMLKRTDVEDMFVLRGIDGSSTQDIPLDVSLNGETLRLSNTYSASNNILDFIQLNVVSGDITRTLSTPNELALSESEALRIFGSTDAVGNTLNYEGGRYTIGAVFSDLPENTHFVFDTLAMIPETSNRLFGFVYLRLLTDAAVDEITQEMTTNLQDRSVGINKTLTISLNRLSTLHFNSDGPFEMKKGGSWLVVQSCIALTLLLLFIATVNFVNLNIAAAARRAKEVGVRKALGATQGQLILQFILESLMVVAIAAVVAVSIVELSLPYINTLLSRSLSLNFSIPFIVSAVTVVMTIGVISGLYPALFIASFSAKRVLSGDLQRGQTAIKVRKLTLCVQAGLSMMLTIAAITVVQQINLINALPIGYSKENRIVVNNLPSEYVYKPEDNSFLRQLRQIDGVQQLTASDTNLTNDMTGELRLVWPNGETLVGTQPTIATGFYPVATLGLELIAGRDASPEFSSDWLQRSTQGTETFGVLITEQLARMAGYSEPTELLGKTLGVSNQDALATVIGVIKDIKLGSARQEQLPASVVVGNKNRNSIANLVIKVDNDINTQSAMAQIREIVNTELGITNIQISTVEADYRNAHKVENTLKTVVTVFSLLVIVLTCLGIFGLASFAVLRRQKEISMRKVLGASRRSIVNLIATEFIKLVLVGAIIASPLCYWLVNEWLTTFNYRIVQQGWFYLGATGLLLVITWMTVASLAFKAASTRPAQILRYE